MFPKLRFFHVTDLKYIIVELRLGQYYNVELGIVLHWLMEKKVKETKFDFHTIYIVISRKLPARAPSHNILFLLYYII